MMIEYHFNLHFLKQRSLAKQKVNFNKKFLRFPNGREEPEKDDISAEASLNIERGNLFRLPDGPVVDSCKY
jgi:hypothetical protein